MQHHDRRAGRVARTDIDDVKGSARDCDHLAPCGMGALRQQYASLRDQGQRQGRQRRHNHCHH